MNMVEDPIRLLDRLKIQKAHVVGYSMGVRRDRMRLFEQP
jgi:pimeloyl-ACP methyl ester carboxylesterase